VDYYGTARDDALESSDGGGGEAEATIDVQNSNGPALHVSRASIDIRILWQESCN
jgi:hypothetical protein